jgi:hypothetical protein
MFSSRWEDILKNKEINEIFSNDGINNYTNQRIDINYDYNFDEIIDGNYNSKDNDNLKDNTNLHRIIISTPFNMRSVISYGLMVFAKDTKRWVIVRDQHTSEYILLVKGYYRPTFTKFLLSKITPEEYQSIKNCLTSAISEFVNLYLNDLRLEKDGLLYAVVRMAESRTIILDMINGLDISNNTLPWNWPKGRIEKESEFECAIREFTEEVEINLPPPILVSDTYVEETITTVTGRKLESRFWIYVIPNEIELKKPVNHREVSDRMWVDTETCINLIPKTINHIGLFKKVLNNLS